MAGTIKHCRFSHKLFLKVKEGVNRGLMSVSLGSWCKGRAKLYRQGHKTAPENDDNSYESLDHYLFWGCEESVQ